MDNYDITGDGVKDLIIGRHDGNIEVYAYDEGDEAEPVLKYSHVRPHMNITVKGIYLSKCLVFVIFRTAVKVLAASRVVWLGRPVSMKSSLQRTQV